MPEFRITWQDSDGISTVAQDGWFRSIYRAQDYARDRCKAWELLAVKTVEELPYRTPDVRTLAARYRADAESKSPEFCGYPGRPGSRMPYFTAWSIYAPGFLVTGMVNDGYDPTNRYSTRVLRWREPIGLPVAWMGNVVKGKGRASGNMAHTWRRVVDPRAAGSPYARREG